MTMLWIALASFCLALIPAALFAWNLFLVRPPRRTYRGVDPVEQGLISVLIPARNEARRIAGALDSVLANRDVELEVIVLDDHSTDGTADVVTEYVRRDSRVSLRTAPDLPPGWCGKQHACDRLAREARGEWLVFLDADVRLSGDALGRMVAFMQQGGSALSSGVPRQVTGSFLEHLLVPLVHFVLLGFLPVWRMRRCTKPAYAAGCGQLFIARAAAYSHVGGHARIRHSLHDGITLPRVFRQSGFRTDLFDATDVASCRMYVGAREVVEGSMKNAHEALASPRMIAPMTIVLLGGQVLPLLFLVFGTGLSASTTMVVICGVMLGFLPRLAAVVRFRQSPWGALLHPVSVALYVGLQWWALFRMCVGRSPEWRGRVYPSPRPSATPTSPGGLGVVHQRVRP